MHPPLPRRGNCHGARLIISGILLHVRPGDAARVSSALAALPGVATHSSGANGRLIVTLEADDARAASDLYGRLHDIEGVVAVTLAYHLDEMSEETDAADAT